MAESAKEKKDKLPGSNLLSKLLIRKINKSKGNKEAKKAAIDAAPGTSRLEKKLNVAGAKARVKKAERQENRGKRKEEKAEKKSLRKSNRAVKKATIASMPGTSKLEKRLNFAGAKSRARKADRQESKKLKKQGPLQQTSRKIEMPSQEVKNPLRRKLNVPDATDKRSQKPKSETRKSFEKDFAAARKAGKKVFEFRGKKYNTKMAMDGAKLDYADGGKMPKYKDGGKLKEVPSKAKGLSKLPTSVRNKMGYAKHGSKVKAMYGAKMKKK